MSIDALMKKYLDELGSDHLKMLDCLNTGKKLRSKLLLKIAPNDDLAFKICACIELIHAASLLHDDVIDEADTRRGRPSINASFGAKNAIMLGDVMYSKAFFELAGTDMKVAQILSNAVVQLSIGELEDVHLGNSFNKEEDKYINMIYQKTASLIEASARVGAYLAGLCEDDFATYGKNLGLAFQIIDDLLDVCSNEATLGKPAMSDFLEGKSTLVYIYLYKAQNEEERQKLEACFKKALSEEELAWFKDQLEKYKIINKCKKKANEFGVKALNAIEKYENKPLEDFIKSMIDREF